MLSYQRNPCTDTDLPNSAQLQGTPTIPPTYIWVRVVVWECGDGRTDTHTCVTNIHFASATPHAKCKYEAQCC